ncbi:Uncharacterised protein [Klebsiella pneumoniae]|nr:Uncharacterised protein [Klebsiella pneumoniae]
MSGIEHLIINAVMRPQSKALCLGGLQDQSHLPGGQGIQGLYRLALFLTIPAVVISQVLR